MRFSPGSRSVDIAAPTLSHLKEDDQGACGQVGTVRDRSLHGPLPDDVADRREAGQDHTVKQRLDRRQRAEQNTHEGGELDVSESERLGLKINAPTRPSK